MKIVAISSKGQVTIPLRYRKKIRSKYCIFDMQGQNIILKPVKIELNENDSELNDFGMVSKKSFDFWDNPEDDIYDKFYNNK